MKEGQKTDTDRLVAAKLWGEEGWIGRLGLLITIIIVRKDKQQGPTVQLIKPSVPVQSRSHF